MADNVKVITFLTVLLSMPCFGITEGSKVNWSGNYAPCHRNADLLSRQPMSLAVKISTADTVLAQQFKNALDFWSEVLELDWHEVSSEDCSIQLVDGTPALFDFAHA